MSDYMFLHRLSRRSFLAGLTGAAATLIVACAPPPPPTPAPAPAQPAAVAPTPTAAPKPAAPTPTAVPVAKPEAKAPVELRLHVRLGAEGTKTEMGITAFEKYEPAIKVKLETFPGAQYQEKILTMGAGGTMGDVAFTHIGFYHQTADGGFWAALDPTIKAQNFDMGQYYKAGLDHLTWKGKLYALPYKGHTGFSGIWYNKEMLEKEKLDPATLRDHNDLIEMAKKLTRDTTGAGKTDEWGYLYAGHDGWALTPHLRAFGGDPVSPGLGATKALLDQPERIAAVTWLHDIIHKHKITPLPGAQDYVQVFVTGKAGMRNGGLWQSGDQLAIGTKFTQAGVSMPKGPGGTIPMIYNHDQMAMGAKTKYPDESWKLLAYFCGKEQGIRLGMAEGGGASTPGIRKDVYGSDELAKAVPSIKWYAQHLAQAEPMWYTANLQTGKVWTTIKQVLDKILLDPKPPAKADFEEANKIVQGVLDEPRP